MSIEPPTTVARPRLTMLLVGDRIPLFAGN